ncbi:Modulator of FtsH protease HflK [Rickettsiales endosymbiont of Paramecium tredecaurelia]|uniref:FtsH protease activity modulator HflK n=1 Tax=Candidatus Sarmatiella mevalonica TaxID=2770581 RepID=UPI0019226612|nr:FtsH protease activity modulator HflK [Candidatus Sarmatiella mevalonica]MBL3284969.1 Modulator of FtsH protease HflK [Candidatus Sarmatiella mevalonica]
MLNFSFKSPWDDGDNVKNDDFFKKFNQKSFFSKHPKFPFQLNNCILFIVAGIVFAMWCFSGFYQVREGEEAVVTRFGRAVRKSTPGLNYHLPFPIEVVLIEQVNKSRRTEIGYRSSIDNGSRNPKLTQESTMLTGDENIVELNCDVIWHISDLEAYLFNLANPEDVVKSTTQSVIREVIACTSISAILSDRKQEISEQIQELTQSILNEYHVGVHVDKIQLLRAEPPAEVIDAYRDVQTAKADKEKEINQAHAYSNNVLPRSRGEAAKLLEEAQAYKQEITDKAKGDVARYKAVYSEYVLNKQVTRDRLYLGVMEKILAAGQKVVTNSVLPHMPLGPEYKNAN